MSYKKPDPSFLIQEIKSLHQKYRKYVEDMQKSQSTLGYLGAFFVSQTPSRAPFVQDLKLIADHLEENWDNIHILFPDMAGGTNTQNRKFFKHHVILGTLFGGFISIENEMLYRWFRDPQNSMVYASIKAMLFPKTEEFPNVDPSINKTSRDIEPELLFQGLTAAKKYCKVMNQEAIASGIRGYTDMIKLFDLCLTIVEKRLSEENISASLSLAS